MKKILALIIVVCLIITSIACGGNAPEYKPEPSGYDKTETGNYIVKNGSTEYVIVLPDKNTSSEKTAADELTVIFNAATGINLRTVVEKEYSGNHGIYLGNTLYRDVKDGSFDRFELGESGFRILTADKDIIIYGNTDTGTLYGVYGFLTDLVDFEPFTYDYYYVNEELTDIKLFSYDITDIPDIQIRMMGYGYVKSNKTLLNRLRSVSMYEFYETFGNNIFHNTFGVVSPEIYKENHPKWFAEDELNLCFTAHGDKAEYEALMTLILNSLEQYIVSHPNCKEITFTHEDNQAWCSCEACRNVVNEYGANSAILIHFMNDLRSRLDAWFETDGSDYKRKVDLVFFAYHATNIPPVVLDSQTGRYVPKDDTVVCKKGVVPLFAESNGDYTHSFYEEENRQYAENFKGWNALSDKIFCWIYGTNFSHKFTIYDTFSAAPDSYRFFADNGAYMLFEEATLNGLPTGFGVFKYWLFSKLTWNSKANVKDLTDRFFRMYFRDAEKEMKDFFNAYRQLSAIQKEQLGYGGGRSIFYDASKPSLWPQRTLSQWNETIDKALRKIEYLKDVDLKLYDNLYDNITGERLSVLYLLLQCYSERFTDAEAALYRKQFYDDSVRLGHSGIENIYKKIGIM